MTDQPIVQVKDLTKDFILSHSGAASVKSAVLWWKKGCLEHLHVLRGISFDVPEGQCLGIVGRNGAGKSTLLALLAQVYRPTSGLLKINGRIAPLLELGAGFHPDLTGLENIFVNGIILGISHKELEKRLDTIIEFSELYNHIDAPVRTYSSGMCARLGFSIAVHVDADVLLVDEVLAVGDFEFREKCCKRIDELKAEGKTIIVVSHGSADLERLADRCIWLQNGLIQMDGPPGAVLLEYESHSTNVLAAQRENPPPEVLEQSTDPV